MKQPMTPEQIDQLFKRYTAIMTDIEESQATLANYYDADTRDYDDKTDEENNRHNGISNMLQTIGHPDHQEN
jgi:hypothetical protein